MQYQPVKGTHDIYGKEAIAMRFIENTLAAACELFGYKEIMLPTLEYTEVFSRGTGEGSDIVRKEMYTFLDKGNRSVTMRPEFTAGVMRSIISNKLYAGDLPLKLFYQGPAFRYERPQLGRYRQFHQFGVEEVGLDSARADAECVILAVAGLQLLGFENIKVKINSLGDAETRANYRKALVEYFSQHVDEMCEDCKERLNLNPLRILDCKVEHDQEIAKGAPKIKDYMSEASEKRFYETLSYINNMEIEYEIDENLVRGLDYYSEFVFEIHLTSPEGKDYGACCGGGHYGGLLKELGGPDLAGVGFAMGVERIYSLMMENGLLNGLEDGIDLFVMPVGETMIDEAFQIGMACRTFGYSTEIPLTASKFGTMFKKAERLGARFALIVGEEEVQNGVLKIKNIQTQEQSEISLENLQNELARIFDAGEEHHCCGHHHDDEECCCGHHHDDEGCCCGHHHDDNEECCCHDEHCCCHHEE